MKLSSGKSGPILDAVVKATLNQVGDVYDVDWKLKVRIGRKVWGKFIGKTEKESGSIRIPKKNLREEYLRTTETCEIAGLKLKRVKEGHFKFEKGQAKGDVYFGFDGHDPVEIRRIKVKALGMKLDLK